MSLQPGRLGNLGQLGVGGRVAAAGNGLLTGLVAYWPSNESVGNALDLHTNALTLTASASAPTAGAGLVYPTARAFSRASNQNFSRATAAGSPLRMSGASSWTVASWVRMASKPTVAYAFSTETALFVRGIGFYYRSNVDRLRCIVGSTYFDAAAFGSPPLNTWMLILACYDVAGKACISVNNGAANEQAVTMTATTTVCYLGGTGEYAGGNGWDGLIGPATVWSRLLTAEQKTAVFNGGAGLPYSGYTA